MNKQIPTVIYCRKSQEDHDSIERQQDVVRHFVEGNPDLQYCYAYRDDGFTGTDFDRPGWKRMMKDLERGLVKCLVVKDDNHPAIVSREQYEAVQELFFKRPVKEPDEHSLLTSDPLKGIVYCGSCGRKLAYIRPNEKTGVKTA